MNNEPVIRNTFDRIILPAQLSKTQHDARTEPSGTVEAADSQVTITDPRSDYDWDCRTISMVATSWRPFEVTFMVAATACGIAMLTSATRMSSLADTMPVLTHTIWRASLVPVGILGLVGISWRGELATGLAIRLGALILLGTATSMYAVAMFTASGIAAMPVAAFVAAVPVAAWWRSGQITKDLLGLARTAKPPRPAASP
ncbi:hypothetical protein AB0J90_19650 [Micromonospora sp. NPDC049523]|uniref:hypothetical protein n=1 Tax=Micromonospora sp. NPDC049523 TaxID=3155921 RepID=UPI003426B28D